MTDMQNAAEVTGLKALSWLAGHEELLPIFCGATGAAEQDFRARLGEPEFLVSVLDFILMDDAWIRGFCDAEGLPYDAPFRARQMLPGGGEVSWT